MVGNSSTRLTRSFFYAWQPLFWEALCLLLEEEDRGLELNRVVLYILAYNILIHCILWFSWCDSKLQFTERASQDRETAKHKKSFFPQIFQFKLIIIYEIISRLIMCSNIFKPSLLRVGGLRMEKVSLESECLPWPHFWSWPKWPRIEQRPAHYTTMSHRPQ